MSKPHPRYGDARDALLSAVIRTVARVGLRGLTYRSVAAEAGVSYGSVTHHFGSRRSLIAEALKQTTGRAIGLSALGPGTGEPPEFVADLPAAVQRTQDAHAFQFELALESRRDQSFRPAVRDLYELYQLAVSRELTRVGVDDDPAFTRLILATLDGLVFQQVIGVSRRSDVEAALSRLRDLLTNVRSTRSNHQAERLQ